MYAESENAKISYLSPKTITKSGFIVLNNFVASFRHFAITLVMLAGPLESYFNIILLFILILLLLISLKVEPNFFEK